MAYVVCGDTWQGVLLVCGTTVWCCRCCVVFPLGLSCGMVLVVVVARCCHCGGNVVELWWHCSGCPILLHLCFCHICNILLFLCIHVQYSFYWLFCVTVLLFCSLTKIFVSVGLPAWYHYNKELKKVRNMIALCFFVYSRFLPLFWRWNAIQG